MGMIDIEIKGSFGYEHKVFGPANHGHADVVAQVIEWLASEILPKATVLDHVLHDQDALPPSGWKR